MFGGSLGVILGVVGLPQVATFVLWLPWLALAWTVAVVQWTASLPFASLTIAGYGLPAMIGTYALIFGLRWRGTLQQAGGKLFSWLRVDWLARLATPGLAGALTVTSALVWAGVLTQPDGRLHVWFLDIGQGDGIFIQTPSGRQVLVDGGASPQALFAELGAVMPFWDRKLDLAVLTHPDGDHMIAQVETPARLQVDAAWTTAAGEAHPDAQSWRTAMAAGGDTVRLQHTGGWADLGDGVALWVLSPPAKGYSGEDADNDNSIVTKLVYGDFTVLLTGDAGLPVEHDLMAAEAPLRAVVLKAGHHGSRSATSAPFVAAVDPSIAVIQVGKENDYGHPHADVLAQLAGRLILRNDEDGRIEMISDGHQLWLMTER